MPFLYRRTLTRSAPLPDSQISAGNNLVGQIPSDLCLLSSSVQVLDFGNNGAGLSGQIPICIDTFHRLIKIELDDNGITGSLPPGLLSLPSLEKVEVYRNNITGTIPEIGGRRLTTLLLEGNELTGTLPKSIEEAVNLG